MGLPVRKGVYIGVWAPEELKRELRQRGSEQHRSLSQEVIHRLEESIKVEDKQKQERAGEK